MDKLTSIDVSAVEKISVVIAEDDPKISEIQTRFVEKVEGFEVVGIGNTISECEDIIEVFQPDLVLLDIYFPDGNGIDLLWKIRPLYKQVDVVLITAAKEVEPLQDAIRGGVFDYILKPTTFSRLQRTLLNFAEHRKKIHGIVNLEQADVDQIIRPVNQNNSQLVDERMPKSIDPLTLDKVGDVVRQLQTEGTNAETMGARVGISRTTARRYLEYLVSQRVVTPSLVYGSVGRPERLYFQVLPK